MHPCICSMGIFSFVQWAPCMLFNGTMHACVHACMHLGNGLIYASITRNGQHSQAMRRRSARTELINYRHHGTNYRHHGTSWEWRNYAIGSAKQRVPCRSWSGSWSLATWPCFHCNKSFLSLTCVSHTAFCSFSATTLSVCVRGGGPFPQISVPTKLSNIPSRLSVCGNQMPPCAM